MIEFEHLKFNGNQAWFVSPENKYGLSKFPAKKITDGDFSFLAKIKPNWDKMSPNDKTREGGIIIKNGLHLGLSVIKPDDDHVYVKGTIWTIDAALGSDGMKNSDILVKVNNEEGDLDKELEVGFSFKKGDKEFSVYCNGTWHTKKYEGTILDYSNAWLWVGASNPLESCPEDFMQFYNGEIYNIAIFYKALDKEEIYEIYQDFENISKRLKPVCAYNFKRQTPYKILDITETGNHLIKFDKEWMNQI